MKERSDPRGRGSIRRWGVILAASLLAEGAIGVASAGQGGAGFPPLLLAHIGLGGVVVTITGWVLLLALQRRRHPGWIPTVFTTFAVAATAMTGAIFLASGFPNGAEVDRVLALVSLGGAASMIVWGGERVPEGSVPASS